MSTDPGPHSICLTCGIDLPEPTDAEAHRSDTMPSLATGARSHITRTINPTPEERTATDIRYEVNAAIDHAIDQLDRAINRGQYTADQVRNALANFPEFADAWEVRA